MTEQSPMMKKRGREGHYCNNRRIDAEMKWYEAGSQHAREDREWRRDWELG